MRKDPSRGHNIPWEGPEGREKCEEEKNSRARRDRESNPAPLRASPLTQPLHYASQLAHLAVWSV